MGQRGSHSAIRKYFQLNERKKTAYQNVKDAVKSMLRGKFLALNIYISKEEILDQ